MNLSVLIARGNAEDLATVLEKEPSLALAPVPGAPSAILLALYHARRDLAELIEAKVSELSLFEAAALGRPLPEGDVNELAADGFSPLGLAAFLGQLNSVEALLSMGANVDLRSQNGLKVRPLQSALANQHSKIVDRLLSAGAAVNDPDDDWTPLHYAAYHGDQTLTDRLFALGAVSRPNLKGQLPTDVAKPKAAP